MALAALGTFGSARIGDYWCHLLEPEQQEPKARATDLHLLQCLLHLHTERYVEGTDDRRTVRKPWGGKRVLGLWYASINTDIFFPSLPVDHPFAKRGAQCTGTFFFVF